MTGISRDARRHRIAPAIIQSVPKAHGFIEVFRTNVATESQASFLLSHFRLRFPWHCATFDLEDCDRIFRVCAPAGMPDTGAVMAMFQTFGFEANILHDDILTIAGLPVAETREMAR